MILSGFLIIHLTVESYAASFLYPTDPASPWTYAQPQEDIRTIRKKLEEIAAVHPDHRQLFIQVFYPNHGYWPLPWLLRNFSHVSWLDEVPQDTMTAPVILIAPSLEPDLIKKLYEIPLPGRRYLYLPLFDEAPALRPGAPVHGYIQKQLWDQIHEK